MKAFTRIAIFMLLSGPATSFADVAQGISISHYEPLAQLSWSAGTGSDRGDSKMTGTVSLRFVALGREFDLQLEPNSSLLSPEAQAALPGDVSVYRGYVRDVPDSWARIVVADGFPRGVIFDGVDLIAIEAPGASAIPTDEPIAWRLADAYVPPGTMGCASDATNAASMFKSLADELNDAVTQKLGAVSEIAVSVIGDFEFSTAMGAGSEAAIIARMNIVDGIYSEQVGVQISTQTPVIFGTANDPFSDTLTADLLLDDLANYRFDTPAHYNHGLTHLFTGRVLDTTTVGIAFSNALCRRFSGAGLTQSTHGEMFDALIAAHEIGHNFGAPHDGQTGSACVAEPQTYIMAPSISGSDQFSACSIAQMQDDIAGASCITPLPSVDMTINLRGSAPVVLLGNRLVLEYDVINRGTLAASNVVADFTLPNNVTLESSSSTLGSCVDGAGVVSCTLGSVSGLSSAVITVFTNATTPGADMLDAVLSADVDDVPGNNQQSVQVTVDPAVNLVVGTPGAAQVVIDQSRTVSATIENQSTLPATNVLLRIVLEPGLRADSANWSPGTCAVSAQQVDCQAASFAAQSISTLNVTVTGISAGAQNYSLQMTSAEVDAYAPDNSASGTVTVTTASGGGSPEEDKGGGAMGAWMLYLLSAAIIAVRRRRRAA